MYVFLEYSFRGSKKSQATPTSIHNADTYGGSLRSLGSRRSANMVGASMVVNLSIRQCS